MSTPCIVQPTAPAEKGRERIVVACDGSRCSLDAVEWAAAEAVIRGSSLRVVPCSPAPDPAGISADAARRSQSLADVVALVRRHHPDLTVTLEPGATHPDPRDALIDAAADADLLIVGASVSAPVKSWLLGSVPRNAARRSVSPVIVVRGDRLHPIRRIVVGVDSSSAAAAALDWASVEAGHHDAELVVVHAWQPSDEVGNSMRARALARADALCIVALAVARCRQRTSGDVRGEVVEGPPSTMLIEASRGADLLAVGSRGRSGFKTMLFGSVALFVVEHADCPVAITHPQPVTQGPTRFGDPDR